MDTVELKGEGFEVFVKNGEVVKEGDLLVRFDIQKIIEAGYSIVTPIVVTNSSQYSDLSCTTNKKLGVGEMLMEVTK